MLALTLAQVTITTYKSFERRLVRDDRQFRQIGVHRALSQQAYILFYQSAWCGREKFLPKRIRSSSKQEDQIAVSADGDVGQKLDSNMRSAWEDAELHQ